MTVMTVARLKIRCSNERMALALGFFRHLLPQATPDIAPWSKRKSARDAFQTDVVLHMFLHCWHDKHVNT